MISLKELLDIIASETIEEFGAGQKVSKEISHEELPVMRYDLRLVEYKDGRMEWED